MDRREFLKAVAAVGAAAAAPQLGGCATLISPIRPDGSPEPLPLEEMLAQGARVMWIAAHPDDECFSGSILARASIYYGNPVAMLVFTHGEGGECGLGRGCKPDLFTVRGWELGEVARLYRATLRHEDFFNAPLPVSSFPKREEIFEIWKNHKDPVRVATETIRGFKPDLVLTFEPTNGATGHPEHQLSSRLATAGIRQAVDPAVKIPGLEPHWVERVYYLLNRAWIFRLIGRADPGPVTEIWDADLPCQYGESCLDFMLRATRLHRTQINDMGNVRDHSSLFTPLTLRQVDPFTEIHDPAEPA